MIKKYVDFIHSLRDKPFTWGEFDCCLFACDVINIKTGIDPATMFRGYDTSMGAMKVLQDWGGVDGIAETVCATHDWEEIDPRFAQRLDLCVTDNGGERLALCVVDLNGTQVVGAGAVGTVTFPISEALRAWRIPECHS